MRRRRRALNEVKQIEFCMQVARCVHAFLYVWYMLDVTTEMKKNMR